MWRRADDTTRKHVNDNNGPKRPNKKEVQKMSSTKNDFRPGPRTFDGTLTRALLCLEVLTKIAAIKGELLAHLSPSDRRRIHKNESALNVVGDLAWTGIEGIAEDWS